MSGTSEWLADHVASLLPKPVTSLLPQAMAGACVGGGTWSSNGGECKGQTCCHWVSVCRSSCWGAVTCTRRSIYC